MGIMKERLLWTPRRNIRKKKKKKEARPNLIKWLLLKKRHAPFDFSSADPLTENKRKP